MRFAGFEAGAAPPPRLAEVLGEQWPQQVLPRIFPACAWVRHPAYFPNEHGADVPLSWSYVEQAYGLGLTANALPSLAAALEETTTELAPPQIGSIPAAVAWRLVDAILAAEGESRCWFGVWEGFGCLEDLRETAQRLTVNGQKYLVLRGPLYLAARPLCEQQRQSVNLWWPPTEAWCAHTGIELDSTLVAGSHALVERILADPELEAVAP